MGESRAKFLRAAALAALATGLFAAWLVLRVGGEMGVLWFSDLATPAAALTAMFLCLRAARGHAGRMRLFWSLLAAASGAWTIAEGTWAVYELGFGGEVPVLSWADAGYLGGMVLTVAALLAHPALHERAARRARSVLDGLIVATALLLLSWVFVLGPLWRSTDVTTLGGVVTLAYPFGDVVTVFFIVLAIRRMPVGDRLALWCLLGGLLSMVVADSVYAYLTQVQSYESGGLLDTAWVVGYLGIALGAHSADARAVSRSTADSYGPPLAQLVAPFLPVLVALGVAGVEIQLGHRLEEAAWVMAFSLVTLVLVRQGLLVVDLVGPGRGFHVMTRLEYAALGRPLPTEASPNPVPRAARPPP